MIILLSIAIVSVSLVLCVKEVFRHKRIIKAMELGISYEE